MMKSRVALSISTLFAGEHRRRILKFISISGQSQCYSSIQLEGFESLKWSVHSSSAENDDFAELGPAVAHSAGTLPKLATQKPERFMKSVARKPSAGRSFPAESNPSVKDLFPGPGKPSPDFQPKLQNCNADSRFTIESNNASGLKSSSSVSVEDIPSMVDLAQLIKAISVFGKISSASMRTAPTGLDCCDIEFEALESRRRAVSVGGITVRNIHLPIRSLHVPKIVTIRINGINKDTAYPAIHSICKSTGALEGLAKVREDMVDAFFAAKDESDLQNILTKLNNTIIDDRQWSAHLQPSNSTPVAMSKNEDSKCEVGLQISRCIAEMKMQYNMKKMYCEDLEYLLLQILHLEGSSSD